MVGNIYIGTSGFSYRHWRRDFYPDELPVRKWLTYYAEHFNAVEINAGFYRLPQLHTLEKWLEQVPEHFMFCPKMSRYLSHMKKLRDPREPLRRFFEMYAPLEGRMGPVLVQLPDRLPFNAEIVKLFYELFHEEYKPHRIAMEVRHDSWLSDESLQLMKEFGVAFVINQSGVNFPYAEIVTSPDVYLRFHGPRALYASGYSSAMLAKYAKKILDWSAKGHRIWAFFNNDIHGFAPKDAARLKELVSSTTS